MTVLLFQDAGILSPYIQAALTLWPVWIAIVLAVGAAVRYRVWEKAGITDTNQKNIDGLRSLLATRDTELSDLETGLDEAEKAFEHAKAEGSAELEKVEKERDILQSEYKALAGLVISDLLHWAGRYEFHLAEMQTKESEIRILLTRIELMERREAENAEIHKSQ